MPDPQGTQAPQAGQGGGAPDASQTGGDAPKHVTEEQLNRAITARFGDFEKKLTKGFGDLLGGVTTKLEETLAAKFEGLKPKDPPPPPPEPKGKDGMPAPIPLQETPEWKAMQAELSTFKGTVGKLEKRATDAEAEARAEKRKAKDTALRQQVLETLGKNGIDAPRAKFALAHLVDSARVIAYGDDDAIVFKAGAEGDLDLESGIKAWLKTDEGKLLIPPRGTKGSGDGPHGGPPDSNSDDPRVRLGAALQRLVKGEG